MISFAPRMKATTCYVIEEIYVYVVVVEEETRRTRYEREEIHERTRRVSKACKQSMRTARPSLIPIANRELLALKRYTDAWSNVLLGAWLWYKPLWRVRIVEAEHGRGRTVYTPHVERQPAKQHYLAERCTVTSHYFVPSIILSLRNSS